MKKQRWLWLVIFPLIFAGCKVGSTTEAKGLENESYLQFVQGQEKYNGGVDVYVDNTASFKAKVDKVNSRTVRGNVYTIKSGTRHLKIAYKGQTLYEKDVFLSSRETKQILLP
ncbi:MAG: hypothetical protein FWF52_02290 [Candidatus Azobacteroides sp.]|nr:hypothetical protein [Candidatus Azobacteroides sp.]